MGGFAPHPPFHGENPGYAVVSMNRMISPETRPIPALFLIA